MSPDVHALSGAYAVDALGPGDLELFEAHLARCSACPAEVAGLREAVSALALLTARTPPSGLRDAVLGAISVVPQD